jgi:magnesium chelatase subunit H
VTNCYAFRILGSKLKDCELDSYLDAYFGDRLSSLQRHETISTFHCTSQKDEIWPLASFLHRIIGLSEALVEKSPDDKFLEEASSIASLLDRSTEEMDSILVGIDGGYVRPKPGGDLLRDGPSVLFTGRNIHALSYAVS